MSMDTRIIKEARARFGKRPHELDPLELRAVRAACRIQVDRQGVVAEEARLAKAAALAGPLTPVQIVRGVAGTLAGMRAANNVPESVLEERRRKCEPCAFARKNDKGKLLGCRICRCGWRKKLRLKKERCCKGDPKRYPAYSHLKPEWGAYVDLTTGLTTGASA